jgi:hypothetical protein
VSEVALASPPPGQGSGWLELAGWCGEAGIAFREAYARPEPAAIVACTDRALALLRRRETAPAIPLLEEAGERLTARRGFSPAVEHVLERWYHGVAAYHYYCVSDLDRAAHALDQADLAVRRAIDGAPFLIPLAHHCHEFQLHHARIARERRAFREMQDRVARTRAMVEGRAPLCVLSDGSPVDYAALSRHLAAILPPGMDPPAEAVVFGDAGLRLRLLDRFLLDLYCLPGFVFATPGAS